MSEQGSSSENQHHPTQEDRLFALLQPAVTAQNLYLEDVHVRQAGSHRTVQVIVDLPDGQAGSLGLDAIAEVSQVLSAALDADPADDGRAYELEVSSPGVARPLTEERHWRRAVGHMVTVSYPKADHQDDVVGRLMDVTWPTVLLRPEIVVKKGMKPKVGDPVSVDATGIKKAVVGVEFNKPSADDEHKDSAPEGAGDDSTPTAGGKRAGRGQKGRG